VHYPQEFFYVQLFFGIKLPASQSQYFTRGRNNKENKSYSKLFNELKRVCQITYCGEKHVNSPLMTPIVSEWLDFFSG
jgi:hypothetical protein